MSIRKKVKRRVVYLFTRLLFDLFNRLPRRLALYLGAWIGLGGWYLLKKDRYKSERHLTLVYEDALSHRQKVVIGRQFFVNSGKNFVDVVRFRDHFESEIKPLVSAEGMEHFEAAYRKGKGLIGVSGHIGNFELMGTYIQSEGYQIGVIGRELYNRRLDEMLISNRKAVGLTNFSTTDSPKKILRWLKDGYALGVLIDTDSHRVRGMFIPAFDRWSNTPVGQTLLGLKAGAAFVPVFCLRMPGNRYRLIVKPPIEYKPTGDRDRDVYNITRRCTEALEEVIRQYPDQWIWLHNRWRTRREVAMRA